MNESEEMLSVGEKRDLLRFCCVMAWSDGYVQQQEKQHIQRLVEELDPQGELSDDVDEWLEEMGAAEMIDPSRIPAEHREYFLDEIREIIESDNSVTEDEAEYFEEFEEHLFPERTEG